MSQQKSDSYEGRALIVCVIAGLAWQGLKTIAAKPNLLSGVSRGFKVEGDLWFHMRNSWGE